MQESLFHLIWEQIPIKTCANCCKLFVPLLRSDAVYCDRQSPQCPDKTCKEYGSKVLWYRNILSDDLAKLARNIYCSKQMLAKCHPDEPGYQEMFEYFKSQKKDQETRLKDDTITREEYMSWLQDMQHTKTPPPRPMP